MISDLAYIGRGFYAFNQVRFRPMCSLSGLNATGVYTKGFRHLINALIDEADISTRKKS